MEKKYTAEYLLKNSNLPGPRGNLELLYSFAGNADAETVEKCLEYINPDVGNSPEEFAGMCGILGYAMLNKKDVKKVIGFIKQYASHGSWRIRESVAMAIQETAQGNLEEVLKETAGLVKGNPLEKRAAVAGFCEPKLLKDPVYNRRILDILSEISEGLDHDNKLDKGEESLRKALGYGWSVVIAASPEEGKKSFERMFRMKGKHIRWIMKENLKKNRLIKLDKPWVEQWQEKLK